MGVNKVSVVFNVLGILLLIISLSCSQLCVSFIIGIFSVICLTLAYRLFVKD